MRRQHIPQCFTDNIHQFLPQWSLHLNRLEASVGKDTTNNMEFKAKGWQTGDSFKTVVSKHHNVQAPTMSDDVVHSVRTNVQSQSPWRLIMS